MGGNNNVSPAVMLPNSGGNTTQADFKEIGPSDSVEEFQ
jgi:hypothetical protein